MQRLASDKYSYNNYILYKEQQIDVWLLTLEKSNPPYHLPGEMLVELKKSVLLSIKNDFNMIIEEYGFWQKCQEKDKKSIVELLFKE